MKTSLESLNEKFPFLTYGKYLSQEYIGIVQNCDNHLITLYAYNLISEPELKKKFIRYGEVWWWESNRQIPINIFLKRQFDIFRPYLKTFIRKEFDLIFGPTVSLQEIIAKRIKRRTIQLVRKDIS